MSHNILLDNWDDYDMRKKNYEERFYFSCEEEWEMEYLIKKIQKFETIPEANIRLAVAACCKTINEPRPRRAFVECIMWKLQVN